DSVGQVLLVLRQSRRYEELELVADAALAHGPDAPAVRRLYAQALVDGEHPAVALRLFTGLAADGTAPMPPRASIRSTLGAVPSAAAIKRCSSRALSRTEGGGS